MGVVLKTKGLNKKYGPKTVTNNISLTINKGDIYGFVGKNGAGKTTFMRLVLGLAFPDSGEIELFGGEPVRLARQKIGSLVETPAIYKKCSAYENMKRFSVFSDSSDKEIKEILDYVGLSDTGRKPAGQFSLGMRQRLGIAIALLGNPEFMILDEPVNGLDPTGIIEVRDLILKLNHERNITFMISSHLLEELSKIATCYGFISEGRLIEEITAQELSEKCSDRIKIVADNPEKAVELLSNTVPRDMIHLNEGNIFIDTDLDKTGEFNKMLVENGVTVKQIYLHSINLEEYFLRKVGA